MFRTSEMKDYVARATPRDLGGVGWYETLSPLGPVKEVDGDILCEWAIIGAGFSGLSAARRLAQLRSDDRIVVIDAQRVGWGSAGRNSGFMIDLPHKMNSRAYAGCRLPRRPLRKVEPREVGACS